MIARTNICPDPRFADMKADLMDRLARVAASVQPENFASLMDPLMQDTLQRGFVEAGAHEGTVWLLDRSGEFLLPAYNTGPNAERFVGRFKQPLNAGLICMVFASEQPFVESEVHKNCHQSRLLDKTLGVQTYALVAVPFYYLGACRGVVSCVQLKNSAHSETDPAGFTSTALKAVHGAATTLSRLLELRLISLTLGLASD